MTSEHRACPNCRGSIPEIAPNPGGEAACPHCGAAIERSRLSGPPAPPKKGRGLQQAALAVVALVVIAFAGARIYSQSRLLLAQPGTPPAAARVQGPATEVEPQGEPALESVEVRSSLTIIRGAGDGRAGDAVVMGTPECPIRGFAFQQVNLGLLSRELIRQGFLIAARDERRLATRDAVIGEPPGDAPGEASLEIASTLREGADGQVAVRRRGPNADALAASDLPFTPSSPLSGLVERVEALSRTEFPAALDKAGLRGGPNAIAAEGEVPEGVEDRLSHLGFVGTFAALRDLHGAIRAEGESPARLGALVRGYSHLGVLTETLWHPTHHAYKARALLYAQRMAARDPKGPRGLWHRAYAEALVGMHREALADLEAAAKAKEASGGPDEPPAWVGLIDALAHCDAGRLRVEDGPHRGLAALLRLKLVEYPMGTGPSHEAAKELLALEPECFRACSTLSRAAGIGILHVTTTFGPQALARLVPESLKTLEALPPGASAAIDRGAVQAGVPEALAEAGGPGRDAGEPSWGALGHLIRETHFEQTCRRMLFMKRQWGVPTDEYWAEVGPSLAGHRYRPFLETLVLPPRQVSPLMAKIAETIDVSDLEANEVEMVVAIGQVGSERAKTAYLFATAHADDTASDLVKVLELAYGPHLGETALRLRKASPSSSYAKAILVEHHWEGVKAEVATWDEETLKAPTLRAALARQYTKLGEHDKAEPHLRRYIEEFPDFWAVKMLADGYKARGDVQGWKRTVEDYLANAPEEGLDHARFQVELADHYMSEGLWAKARPHAEAAAETWAGWGMSCAQRCAEGSGDWPRAELWARRITERYANSWEEWFLFCKRTGHGDLGAARDATRRYLASVNERRDYSDRATVGLFYWAAGDPRRAAEVLKESYRVAPSGVACYLLILVSQEISDVASRDEYLDKLLSKHRAQAPIYCQLLEPLRDKPKFDLREIDQFLDGLDDDRRGDTEFLVGHLLKHHGKPEDARTYFARSSRSPKTNRWLRVLARDFLRELGGPGEPDQPAPVHGRAGL
jgi:tetratricopeptide (TPR) repeat protein